MEEKEELEQIPYIWYLITFKDQTEALPNSENKVNVMGQAFAFQLGRKIQEINVRA